jgi:hypothetical protein
VDLDPHWIRIQKFCGSGSGLRKNAGFGSDLTTLITDQAILSLKISLIQNLFTGTGMERSRSGRFKKSDSDLVKNISGTDPLHNFMCFFGTAPFWHR